MYIKEILLLQGLLLTSISAQFGSQIYNYIKGGQGNIDDKLDYEWNANLNPTREEFCKCDTDECQCCENYRDIPICLIMKTAHPDSKGIIAILKMKKVKINEKLIQNKDDLEFTMDISQDVEDGEITFRLFDLTLAMGDMLTILVKIRIKIGGKIDYVCDLGSYTMYVPGARDDFLSSESSRKFVPKHNDDKCLEVVCGKNNLHKPPNEGIKNGVNVQLGELPWMVHFEYIKKIHFDCSGVILNCYWIITAAQCVYYHDEKRMLNFKLTVGKVDLGMDEPTQKTRSFTHIIFHPKSNSTYHHYNVALVKMDKPIEFNEYIQPICLATLNQNFERFQCVISGWGLDESYKLPNALMKVDTTVYSNEECKKTGAHVFDTHICAGTKTQHARYGDNGGPLQCSINDQYYLAGIFATDYVKERYRFRFEKVSTYIDWITETLIKF